MIKIGLFLFIFILLIPDAHGYCSESESEVLEICYDNFFEDLDVTDDNDYVITHKSLIKEKIGAEYLCLHFRNLTKCLGTNVINNCLTRNQFAVIFDDPESLLAYFGMLDYECNIEYQIQKKSWKKCQFDGEFSCEFDFKSCASLKQSIKDCANKARGDCGDNGFIDLYNKIAASKRLLYPQCKITLLPFKSIPKNDDKNKMEKIEAAINLLSSQNEFDREIIKTQILPIFLESLESSNPNVQLKAIEIFNISSKMDQPYIYEFYPGLSQLINLCESTNLEISEKAIKTMESIIQISPRLRDDCIKMGLIKILKELVSPSKVSVTRIKIERAVASLFSKIVIPQSFQISENIIQELVPFLKNFMDHKDVDVFYYSMKAIQNLLEEEYGNQNDAILDDKMVQKLLAFLEHENDSFVKLTAATINNLIHRSEINAQKFLQKNLLQKLKKLLKTSNKELTATFLVVIGNICRKSQVQAVIAADLLPLIMKLLRHPSPSVNAEAAYLIAGYAKNANSQQIQAIFDMEVVWGLCGILQTTTYKNVFMDILRGLYEITVKMDDLGVDVYGQVFKCGGLEYIQTILDRDDIDEDAKDFALKFNKEVSDAWYWSYARFRFA